MRSLASPILLLASLFNLGCGAKPPSAPAPPRISDAYAKAALKALDTIAAHTAQARITDALFNADAEATSAEETTLTKKLYSVYKQEQDNESARLSLVRANHAKNVRRAEAAIHSCQEKFVNGPMSGREAAGLKEAECEGRARPPDEQIEEYRVRHTDIRILEMDRREATCYKLFADALRNRSASPPKECDSVSIEIKTVDPSPTTK